MSEDTTTIEEMKALALRVERAAARARALAFERGDTKRAFAISTLALDATEIANWFDSGVEHDGYRGCLLGLVRLAWDDPFASAMADGHAKWRMVGSKDYAGLYDYAGLGDVEALVCALEAAP